MKINEYDKILLKDGRTATIVEVLEQEKTYIVDIDLPGPDWDTVEISHDNIEKLV